MEENNIFRLSALLYKDNKYNVKKENTLKKIIESIFINDNKDISIYDAIEFCEKHYYLNITEEDVNNTITKYNNVFKIINKGNGNIRFKLLDKRLDTISNYEITGIEKFIDEFIIEKGDFHNNIKETIYKFLYEVFTTNLNSYEYFIKNNTLSGDFFVDYSKYTNYEVDIINDFLNYNNPEKDKAIFKIVSLSLEYCVLTGNGKQVYPQGLDNKVFYLDTNIIYRAIGINGDERKNLTLKFIEKCNEVGIKIKISKYSEEEFGKSLDFHIKNLDKHKNSNVSIELYERYKKGKDIYNVYLEWKSGRVDWSVDKFRAYLKANYEDFKKRYRIDVDYKNINIEDENNEKIIDEISHSIEFIKIDSNPKSNIVDAKNILLIDNMRKKCNVNNKKLLEVKFFLISTDQKLREWNLIYSNNEQPIVFLPSQWLAIILRFVSATSDDFKSFVSFLNIKKTELNISKEKLQSILEGISEITQDIRRQEYYANEIIEASASDIIRLDDVELIYEKTKDYVKASMDEELNTAKDEISYTKDEIASVREENQLIKIREVDICRKMDNIIEINIENYMNSWKKHIFIFIPLFILSIIFLLLHIFFKESEFNIVTKLYLWAGDDNSSIWLINCLSGFVSLTLSVFSANQIWNRIVKSSKGYKDKKEKVEQKVKGTYSNY